jgi:hypothetical protein
LPCTTALASDDSNLTLSAFLHMITIAILV